MGWLGNIFIVIGLWQIGNKKRWAFIFSILGEIFWIINGFIHKQYDLAFICVVFAILAGRSWYKWR